MASLIAGLAGEILTIWGMSFVHPCRYIFFADITPAILNVGYP
jgi:hypothetical protein